MVEKRSAKELLQKVIKERDAKKLAKEEKNKAHTFFHRVFDSLNKTRTRKIIDPNTGKFIGIRFKYIEDSYGKSIYDYVCYNNDPFELKLLEKIEVQFDPNDPKDNTWVDKPVNIVWLDRHY